MNAAIPVVSRYLLMNSPWTRASDVLARELSNYKLGATRFCWEKQSNG
jgi:hypothetical protein